MGFFANIIIIALLVIGAWYGYSHFKIDTMEVCMDQNKDLIPITCEVQNDCILYLTSAYTNGYPRSDTFTGILNQVTSCDDGHCYLNSFDFKENRPNNRCEANETALVFKVTLEDMMAIRGVN